jgi:hypothetical protein
LRASRFGPCSQWSSRIILISVTYPTRDSMAQLPTIDFAWWRDPKGYRLVDSTGPACVMRNGPSGTEVPCHPLNGEEFRIFARTVHTARDVLDFVQRFGPLTWDGSDPTKGDLVALVTMNAHSMRQRLDEMSRDHSREPDGPGSLSPFIGLRVVVMWDSETRTPRWAFNPNTLLDALWLQFGQAITRGAQIRSCQHCGAWFEAGLGTGRRADAKFCSDGHRIAFNSLKRRKGD